MDWNFKSTYATLPPAFYAYMDENEVSNPTWLIRNEKLADELGVSFDEALDFLAGNEFSDEVEAIAQSYAGHQFGHFAMLGDGRAVLLGELERDGRYIDVQLKGAGRTPYSRGGDGRAAVGPMLREYLMSEAMHALRIPTTRSLAVVKTGEMIQRETLLEGAILTRVASSHLRVGTFEFAARFTEHVQKLADYAIMRHDGDLQNEPDRYEKFLARVIDRQAQLVAKWQQVGFVHGVMNTDNTTISGETIDYGPCAFIDTYSLEAVFSSIDAQGRYAFGNQPNMAIWNVTRLAEALMPLFSEDQEQAVALAKTHLNTYPQKFYHYFFEGMLPKFGLRERFESDEKIVEQFLKMMESGLGDYTNSFRALSEGRLEEWMEGHDALNEWFAVWRARLEAEGSTIEEAQARMREVNPAVIPRNFYVDEAIRFAEQGDMSKFETLLQALQTPFELKEELSYLATPPTNNGPFVTYCGT